jgi:uncharacterized integral membrane protein
MKKHHLLWCIIIVLLILFVIHYFTKHNGQSVAGSFIPGVNG